MSVRKLLSDNQAAPNAQQSFIVMTYCKTLIIWHKEKKYAIYINMNVLKPHDVSSHEKHA